ncbi:MAG: hypothetical protein HWD61_08300 [Parachlamydiaceae bacterium]|nr:MAG: hypothetical protein HWD61_08300 [Parachlamydiaceae bacterium]
MTLGLSSDLSMSEVLKKIYERQNAFIEFVNPDKLEKVTWMWLKDLENISQKN